VDSVVTSLSSFIVLSGPISFCQASERELYILAGLSIGLSLGECLIAKWKSVGYNRERCRNSLDKNSITTRKKCCIVCLLGMPKQRVRLKNIGSWRFTSSISTVCHSAFACASASLVNVLWGFQQMFADSLGISNERKWLNLYPFAIRVSILEFICKCVSCSVEIVCNKASHFEQFTVEELVSSGNPTTAKLVVRTARVRINQTRKLRSFRRLTCRWNVCSGACSIGKQ
jgi:hypothetical protein